jgi:hypothetical protein
MLALVVLSFELVTRLVGRAPGCGMSVGWWIVIVVAPDVAG